MESNNKIAVLKFTIIDHCCAGVCVNVGLGMIWMNNSVVTMLAVCTVTVAIN